MQDREQSRDEMLLLAFKAMMENSPDLVFVKDAELRYVLCSRPVAKLAGLSDPAGLIGKTDRDILGPEYADAFEEVDRTVIASGQPSVDKLMRIPSVGGKTRYTSTSRFPLRSPSGDIIGLYGTAAYRSAGTQKATEDKLRQDELDGMTAVYNKAATEEIVARRLAYSGDETCALLIADLDDLKGINDTLGHIEGDKAIVRLAQLLKGQFRQSDIIGRVGGDEFVVFLEGVAEANINSILALFKHRLATLAVGENDDHPVTCSIGIAMGRTSDTYEELFKKADKALYQAKRSSKAEFSFYGAEA